MRILPIDEICRIRIKNSKIPRFVNFLIQDGLKSAFDLRRQ